MKMVMMLRFSKKPNTPSENRTALRIRYQERGTILVLPPSQDHRAHDGDQDQHRGDFKGQEEIAEEQVGDVVGGAEVGGVNDDASQLMVAADHDPAHKRGQRNHSGNAQHQGHAAAATAFFRARVQQHDDENEQHHDGSGIDDDLDGGDKFGSQQQVNQC